MKVRLSNGTSCSLFPKQYEKFEASVSMEIEFETTEEKFDESVAQISKQISEYLKKEIEVKTAEYLVKTENTKSKIRTALNKM